VDVEAAKSSKNRLLQIAHQNTKSTLWAQRVVEERKGMTKADFVKLTHGVLKVECGRKQLNAASQDMVDMVLDAAGKAALAMLDKGVYVPLSGLGMLKAVKRAARAVRNPKTGELMTIPARKAARFTPCKALKDALK
jgi:DNA-binding protein HU-beta